MAFNLNDFRSQLEFGGSKSSLFEVQIRNPVNNAADLKSSFMIKAAQLPQSTLGEIPVSYFGRKIYVAGDRTFEPWQVTVINDEDFIVRNALEQWSSNINAHVGNIQQFGTSAPAAYKTQALITQYGKNGNAIRQYKFDGLFPTEVSAMESNWESESIHEFQVTFRFDWWTVDGPTGNADTDA